MIGSYELGKTADKYISGDASFTWEEIKGDLFKVAMTGTSMWGSAKDFGTSYCFVAGTLVTTEDGQEPIEEIEVGDKVLSEDETTGEVAVKTVTETYVNETDELIHIGVNGETISATPTHPFYVDKLGWTLARSLRAGDVLVLSNGELVTVEWVQHEILESPIKVYNFEVEDFHTYFVGENGIFVHNGCGDEIPWSSKEVKSGAEDLEKGALSVTVTNRSQAEELFLGMYQGDGYVNTSGWSSKEVSNFYGSRGGTYHWDDTFDSNGVLQFHSDKNPDSKTPHLQIHPERGKVIRIFFGA